MIKRSILFVLFVIGMASCALPRFTHIYESPKGLNFRVGKWLVCNVETQSPFEYQEGLTRDLLKGLRKLGDDSIFYLNDVRLQYLVPDKLTFELSPEVLKVLKKTTDYRFVVTSTARKVRDEVGNIVYGASPLEYQKSESEVCIAVYDVMQGTRIYYQRVIGSVALNLGDEKILFARSAGSLLYNTMSSGLKDLKQNSRKISKVRRGKE